jgi:hypothetical protein
MKIFVSKFKMKKLLRYIPIMSLLACAFLGAAFADGHPVVVNNTADFRNNSALLMQFIVRVASSIAVVGGLGLLFSGILSLYGSHVKKGAGGKPAAHGLTLLGCGAMLIGLPYLFVITANTFWGQSTTKVGENDGQIYQLYSQVIGQDDMD